MTQSTRNVSGVASSGIGTFSAIGIAIAVQISWGINHAIGWAIWHGLLGWIYVIYRWAINSY